MKLAFWSLLLLLVFLLVGFALSNPSVTVAELQVGAMRFESTKVIVVVTVAMVVGVIFTGVWALVEGASIRLTNRRLRREIQRLETENNFLRTQHATAGRQEPDAPAVGLAPFDEPVRASAEPSWRRDDESLPHAPVYGIGEEPSEPD